MAGLALAVDILAKDRASGTLKKVGDQAGKTGKKFDGLKAGFAGAAVGQAVGNFFRGGIEGMQAAQEASAQTAAVLKSMGPVAGRTQDQIEGLADKIEKMSGLEAENVQAGQNMLLTFDKIRGANFDRATMAMADMAARMGGDAVGAATMLGKALNDPAKGMSALTRVGVSFSKEQQEQIKGMQKSGDVAGAQTVILKALESQFGGSAEAAGKTMGGQLKILQARFGDVQEAVVIKLLPALTKLGEFLSKALTYIQENQKWLVPLVGTLGGLAAVVWTVNKAVKAYTAVQAALNVVMLANPIGLVVLAIAGLVAAFVVAYKKSETFRNVVNGAFNGIKSVVGSVIRFVVDKVLGFFGTMINAAATAFGWVPGIGPKLKAAAEKFGEFRDSVNASLSGIQDKEVTIRLKKIGTGAQELDRIADEKAFRRNPTAPPTKTFNTGGRTAGNIVVQPNYDGRKVTSAVSDTQQQRTVRGYLGPS